MTVCQALAEFEMYRQRMEDSQLCTEAQHTQRVVSMSREVRTHTHAIFIFSNVTSAALSTLVLYAIAAGL